MLQLPPLHSADDMRLISDLAHRMEGGILGVAGVAALLEWLRHERPRALRLIWPAVFAVAGVALLSFLLIPHHGLEHAREQWAFIFGDAQQRQHVMLAILTAVGGLGELRHRMDGASKLWRLVWPATMILGGAMFALHPQHGSPDAVRYMTSFHRTLGLLFIITGTVRLVQLRDVSRRRWLGALWPVTLLGASAMLFAYREPRGAYEGARHGSHGSEASSAPDSARQRR